MKKLSMGLVIVIYCFAGFLQAQLFLNWDVNWLMLAAQRLLQGGNYAQNFFETNPPLILYLYMPPLWASKFFSISQGMALCLYVFFAASISLSGCYLLLQRIFLDEKNSVFLTLFFTTLTAVFLLVPLYEFGQRDHLVLIFTLPYLLLVSLRLQNQALRADRACLIGVLAGVGFCIKPQTLFVPLLIELYYSCHKKNVLAWFRVEIVMMLSFAFFYLAALFYFFPDYLYFMVPFASRYYYYASMTWRTLLLFNPFLFCLLPFLFCLITPVHKAYVQLNRVLLLALLGFLGSYLAQRHIYYYHLVPAFSLALFLLVLYVGGWAAQDRWGRRDYWRALVLSALVTACLYWRARAIWVALIFTPFAFFSYFAVLFSSLFYVSQLQNFIFKGGTVVAGIILMGWSVFYLLGHSDLYPYTFPITLYFLLISYALIAAKMESKSEKRSRNWVGHFLTAFLGVFVFAYPLFTLSQAYGQALAYKNKMRIDFKSLNAAGNLRPSVCYFNSTMVTAFMNLDFKQMDFGSRFPFLWAVVGLVNHAKAPFRANMAKQISMDRELIVNMIAADLRQNQPEWVLVDVSERKPYFRVKNFDYLAYFSENANFRKAWQHYRYLTTLEEKGYYKLAVYKQVKSPNF